MTAKKIQYSIAPGFEGLESWIKQLPVFFPHHGTSIFKDRNEVRVFEEAGFQLNVKAFKLPHLVNRYVYVSLRSSKAARSFQNALRFQECGASTPRPVAYVECLSNGKLEESFYISLHFPCDFTLREVLNDYVSDKENILIQWVRFTWSQLHKNGIYHLDYSPGNTLIQKSGDIYNYSVVDLNRMKFFPVDFEKGLRNFRQLACDIDTLRIIAMEYARLCDKPSEKAVALLLKYDQSNKNYRRRKDVFKAWIRGEEE